MSVAEGTYGAQPGRDTTEQLRDLVRLLAGDTGRDGDFFLADTEVDFHIAERTVNGQARPYLAAADALDEMAARVAQRPDLRQVGDVRAADTRDSLVSKFEAQAKKRREQSITRDPGQDAGAIVLSGGVDTDHPSYFTVGQFHHAGTWPGVVCP